VSPTPRYALLADGSNVLIRLATAADLRFFSLSQLAAGQQASRVCPEPGSGCAALLALCGGEVVGCASYERTEDRRTAEVAFAVADRMHHKGVATLLLEYLVAQARDDGISTFTAEQLAGCQRGVTAKMVWSK
jgi:GNAT superfamily N-acetyltransferase